MNFNFSTLFPRNFLSTIQQMQHFVLNTRIMIYKDKFNKSKYSIMAKNCNPRAFRVLNRPAKFFETICLTFLAFKNQLLSRKTLNMKFFTQVPTLPKNTPEMPSFRCSETHINNVLGSFPGVPYFRFDEYKGEKVR